VPFSPPTISRDEIESFLVVEHGIPHVDWGAATVWIEKLCDVEADQCDLRRAVAGAWLDALRDAMTEDHKRWRHPRVEGVGPMKDDAAAKVAQAADRSFHVIEAALRRIRGEEPIPPIAVVALASKDDYISFKSHYDPEEGEWGTSGGVYLDLGPDGFPVLALPTTAAWHIANTIAHEITHHALRNAHLPLWLEEGITQMMEERVTGHSAFKLDAEVLRRHRERWQDGALDLYLAGEAFSSNEDDTQELAYNLSELVVRRLLDVEPERFFAFAKACREGRPDAEAAFGRTESDLVLEAIGAGSRHR